MSFDKALLFKPRLPEDEVEIPGLGTVRVRALSRAEVVDELKAGDESVPFECRLVALAMVEPTLTVDEVAEWRRVSLPDEVEAVTRKINDLSGLTKESAKDAYKEFEADPDAEFRVLPSGEAGDDGGPDAGGDEQL